jgi:xylulokinase
MDAPLFCGLDLSTQQLKAIVIQYDGSIVFECAVHFDRDLPHYGTQNGTLHGPAEGQVTSPVALWVEAIDLLAESLKSSGVDLARIAAISGAGQQHGSVYWSDKAESILSSLKPTLSLHEQLIPGAFSISNSPIWQDSSTTLQCLALEDLIGGQQALADLSGSRAYERFTGPQIAKVSQHFINLALH